MARKKKWGRRVLNNPDVPWTRAFNNPTILVTRGPDRYQIPSDWPEEDFQWGKQPRLAQWTGYPQYSYEQFYRTNPRVGSGAVTPRDVIQEHDAHYIGSVKVKNKTFEVYADYKLRGFYAFVEGSPMYAVVRGLAPGGSSEGPSHPIIARAYVKKQLLAGEYEVVAVGVSLVNPRKKTKAELIEVLLAIEFDVQPEASGADVEEKRVKLKKLRKGLIEDALLRYQDHAQKMPLGNPRRRLCRQNPSDFDAKAVPWNVATNAGPFRPALFPYGQGGRPAEYEFKNNPSKEDLIRALARAIYETVEAAGPQGAPESPIYMAMEQRGIPFNSTRQLVDGLIRAGYITRQHNVLRVTRAKKNRSQYVGSGARGGFVGAERDQYSYDQFYRANPRKRSTVENEYTEVRGSFAPMSIDMPDSPYGYEIPGERGRGGGFAGTTHITHHPPKTSHYRKRKKDKKKRRKARVFVETHRCYNESLEDLPQYSKKNPRLSAAELRAKIAELDKLYQYDQIDDETYHRLRSSLVLEPPRRGETIGSRLAAMEKEVAERGSAGLYPHARRIPPQMPWRVTKFLLLQTKKVSDPQALQKGVPLRQAGLGSEFGVPFPTAILPRHLEAAREEMRSWKTPGGPGAPETQKKISHRIAQYIAYGEVLSAMGASRERIGKFIRATKLASYRPGYRKSKSPRRAATSSLHPWSIFGPGGPKVANIPSWARRFPGITVTEREARRGAKAERIRKKKALRKPPKITGPHASELRRLRAAQLRDQREGWVQAEPEAHWRSQSRQERGDPHADFMYPEGAEAHFRSGMHPKAMQNRGSRGGFVGQERDQLPNWYFLKPGARMWPAGDPRRGARDDMHAEEVIKYMHRGFGKRSEYPGLIKKLAERYPVEDAANKSIWTLYRRYRNSIDEKMSDRGVSKELPTMPELRGRELALANRRRGRKRRGQ